MLKLYGIEISNFYNMVKHTFLEKGVEFEAVITPPSQDAEYLVKSPMGKIPCLETPDGFLCETNVILDYLEASIPQPALMPADAFASAKVKELMRITEHYIDAPARRHLGAVFFGADISDAAVQEVKPLMERGLAALENRLSDGPYACGEQFTLADIFICHAVGLANNICQAIYEWDITSNQPKLTTLMANITARETTAVVLADLDKAITAFMASREQ